MRKIPLGLLTLTLLFALCLAPLARSSYQQNILARGTVSARGSWEIRVTYAWVEPEASALPAAVNAEVSAVESVVVEEPAPVVEEPAPAVEDPAPAVEDPTPVVEEPATAVEEPALANEEPAPVVEEPATAVEEPAPANEEPAPANEEPAPAVEDPTPVVEELPTANEVPAPANEEPAPVIVPAAVLAGRQDARINDLTIRYPDVELSTAQPSVLYGVILCNNGTAEAIFSALSPAQLPDGFVLELVSATHQEGDTLQPGESCTAVWRLRLADGVEQKALSGDSFQLRLSLAAPSVDQPPQPGFWRY